MNRFVMYFQYSGYGVEPTVNKINQHARDNNLKIINISSAHMWGIVVLFEEDGE